MGKKGMKIVHVPFGVPMSVCLYAILWTYARVQVFVEDVEEIVNALRGKHKKGRLDY